MTVTCGRLWPFLYGVLFVVVVRVGLLLRARAASAAVPLPVVRSRLAGAALALAGAPLVASGWHALIVTNRATPVGIRYTPITIASEAPGILRRSTMTPMRTLLTIAGAAMGIDLPEPSRRFSRLAPTD
ncbi:MAG: hypothetical protein ACM3SQ_01985 [Betaproteobacteria bacterium]